MKRRLPMNNGTIIWMAIFAVSALIFFAIASVVTVRGVKEIKELMNDPELNKES